MIRLNPSFTYILPTPSYTRVVSGKRPSSFSTKPECCILLFSDSIWASEIFIC